MDYNAKEKFEKIKKFLTGTFPKPKRDDEKELTEEELEKKRRERAVVGGIRG